MDETELPHNAHLPLQWGDVFTSTDLDQVRERMARYLGSHEVEITERGARLNARVHTVRIGEICFMYVEYGVPVRVKPGEPGFVPVQAHLAGEGTVTCGREQVRTCAERAWVGTPDQTLEMSLSGDSRLVLARFELQNLAAKAADLVGDHVPLQSFELGMDVVTGFPRKWLDLLLNQVHSGEPSALAVPKLEELFTSSLLRAQRNNCSAFLATAAGRPTSSRLVCQAIEMIEAEPHQLHTPLSVARRLGIAAFALDAAFRRCRGVSVAKFVERVRLERVRRELTAADPAGTVVYEVAHRWGFPSPEQFDEAYSARFGELATDTLWRR